MVTSTQPDQSPVAGQVLFYNNPEPLDPVRHANLAMKASERPYKFAAKQHYLPVQVGEFAVAGLNYPIVFAGDDLSPVAIMGLKAGENLYISEDGEFRTGVYSPSFLRRYPFVGARDDAAQRIVVCIDRSFDLWTEEAGVEGAVKLFENGEASQFTKNCIEFCSNFDQDRAMTESFSQLLKGLGILETKQTSFSPAGPDGAPGAPVVLAEYFAVSEERLKALPSEKLVELMGNGALAAIHAHLMSLNNWDRLIQETAARGTPASDMLRPKA